MAMPETSTIIKWATIVLGVGFIVALFAFNQSQPKTSPHTSSDPWNQAMVQGDLNAPNRMVEYTDYFCSFCAELHDAMDDEFREKYIDSGKVSFENRIVNLLSEVSVNTPKGNRAAFCAADQDKYWQYSDKIIAKIQQDYFSKGIGVKNVANPKKIPELENSFFVDIAKEVGMEQDKFASCIDSDKHDAEIERNSQKAISLGVTGLPSITVNAYTASGFGGSKDDLEMIMRAGEVE